MPYATTNKYGAGSGMVVGQQYMPDLDQAAQNAFMGQQGDLNRKSAFGLAQLNQQPEMRKLDFEQGKWNTLLPYIQQSMGGLNQFGRIGGHSGPGPRINAGPIWDQGKIQQQDNAIRAQGDQQTASGVQDMQNRLAGSGYGAKSPLALALETQMGMGNRANAADQVRQFGQNAAQQNAAHVLQGQQAQESQFSNRQQEDIARRHAVLGYQSSLLGMLGQFL